MKLFQYKGQKVITTEILDGYVLDEKYHDYVKAKIPKLIGKDNYIHVDMSEAVSKYGLKKSFNYSRGLNLYLANEIVNILRQENSFEDKIDVEHFLEDIKKNNVRNIYITNQSKKDKVVEDRDKKLAEDSQKLQAKAKELLQENPQSDFFHFPTSIRNVPFDAVYGLVDRMAERQIEMFNQIQQENIQLQKMVVHLSAKVDKLITINSIYEPSVLDTPIILKENVPYEEWKKSVQRACDLIIQLDPQQTQSDILHNAYDRIRNQYGIVWEQEAKEFKKEYNRSPICTRELCWWMENTKPNYKNLLIGKLNTIYSELRRSVKEEN